MFYTLFMIIYLDVIFLNHYVINRIILLWLQAFFPYQGSRIRKEIGLFFMALCQVPEEVLYLQSGICTGIFAFELLAMLVLFWIYKVKHITYFLRILMIYFTGIFILGGAFHVLMEYPWGQRLMEYSREHVFIFYGLFVFIVCVSELLVIVAKRQRQLSLYETKVEVWLEERHFFLRGYMDSGNMLTDDLTGKPVLVGCYGAFEKYLSEEYQYIINDFFKRGGEDDVVPPTYQNRKLRWMICSSVGVTGQVLPLLITDKVRYVINKRVVESVRQPVLLFDGSLMAGAYDVLLNKDLLF